MQPTRRRLLSAVVVATALAIAWLRGGDFTDVLPDGALRAPATGAPIDRAFAERRSNIMVEDSGRVVRLLADDNDGSRHQRFIVEIESGLTVLVAHNIDLAPRIPDLAIGDPVRFSGEYEWNERGGVIHWTHHDPRGSRQGGWVEHAGELFE